MNYKLLISRTLVFFAGLFCSAALALVTYPEGYTPETYTVFMLKRLATSGILSLFIVTFLFYIVTKLAQDRWGALKASSVLIASYLLAPWMGRLFIDYTVTPFSLGKMLFFAYVFPLLLQVVAWVLLFKKRGWATVLLLIGISLLFPILLGLIAGAQILLFGPGMPVVASA